MEENNRTLKARVEELEEEKSGRKTSIEIGEMMVEAKKTADGILSRASRQADAAHASAEAEKLTHADINKTVYAIDDHTVGKAGGTNKIKAGILREIDADSQVIVEIGNQVIA